MSDQPESPEFKAWTAWADQCAKVTSKALASYYRANVGDHIGPSDTFSQEAMEFAQRTARNDAECQRLKAEWIAVRDTKVAAST